MRIQNELIRPAIRARRLRRAVRLVGGGDCAFDKAAGVAYAAWAVWDVLERRIVEQVTATVPLTFPYVPGLLTFREGPALLAGFNRLTSSPDALMFDGVGYAHPRRCGLACHMGVLLGLPSVGVAKSVLCGRVAGELGQARGSTVDLVDAGERIGLALRTRCGVRPVFVSVGHLVTLADAARLALACCTQYRLPEPTRVADRIVARAKAAV